MTKPAALCISRSALTEQGIPANNAHGIYPVNMDAISPASYHFINRAVVDDPDEDSVNNIIGKHLPQLLAYCIIKCGNEYLTYSRKKGAEERLHGSLSLGFGGHVDIEDYEYTSSYANSILHSAGRELREELDLHVPLLPTQFSTVIVDQTNPVGSVHVGLPAIIKLDSKKGVTPNESEIHEAKWQTLEQIKEELEFYEGWSKLVITHLL